MGLAAHKNVPVRSCCTNRPADIGHKRCVLTSSEEQAQTGVGKCQASCDTWRHFLHRVTLTITDANRFKVENKIKGAFWNAENPMLDFFLIILISASCWRKTGLLVENVFWEAQFSVITCTGNSYLNSLWCWWWRWWCGDVCFWCACACVCRVSRVYVYVCVCVRACVCVCACVRACVGMCNAILLLLGLLSC